MQNFDLARQGQRAKGAQEGFVSQCRCGNRLNAIFDLAKRWQRAKAARKGLGPWWNVLRAGFETLLNAEFRPGKAGPNGERCTGGFRVLVIRAWHRCGNCLNAIFDLAKRWQGAKAARKGLGPWWNVLRAGFETL